MSRKRSYSFFNEAEINPKSAKREKKRSRARAVSENENAGTCKEVARREVLRKSESGASLSDDSAYISYCKHPSTPFGSVPPPSLLDSGKGHSVESSFSAINLIGSSSDLSELEFMDYSSPIYFSTPKAPDKREQILYYQQNYIFLKEHLEPLNKIVDEVISRGCKNSGFSEKIREAPSRELRADILLKYAVEHLSQQRFESVLKVSDYGHLIDNLKKGRALESSISEDEDEINLLSNSSFKELLKSELEPTRLIDRLLECGILSFSDHDDILVTSFRRKRVENLLGYLEIRSKRDHQFFFTILKEKYPLLLDEFKESQSVPCQECLDIDISRTDGGWKSSESSIIDEHTAIKVRLELSPTSPDIEMRMVEESGETNMEVEYHQKTLDLQMENKYAGSVVIVYKQLSRHAIQKLKNACRNGNINKYIKSLFTAEDIEKMQQDNVNAFVLTITAEKPDDANESPIITKEAIVRNFSFIEEEITDAEVFFAGFLKCGLLNEESEKILQTLRSKSREERNIEFLKLILRGQAGLIQIFQQELARLGYDEILKRICFDNDLSTHDKITDKELKENESFLLAELEPKEFLPALGKILPEEVQNKIVCIVSRRERAQLFLDEVVKRGQPAVDVFVSELERLGRHFVVKILTGCGTKTTAIDDSDALKMRVHILEHYDTLIEELEPKIFHTFFLEKGVIKEETFEKIVQFSTRRNRAVAFLKWLLDEGNPKALMAFQMAVKLFCDDALVKMLGSPVPSFPFGLPPPVADKTKEAVELYKATFKVTFHYVSDPKIGSVQMQESSTNKDGGEEWDGQSMEKETCTQFCVQNPNMDEEDKMSFWVDHVHDLFNDGLNLSLPASSMQITKSRSYGPVSSHSSKSRNLTCQNMDLIPNKKISPDEKVTRWLSQDVTDESNSCAPLPNDLASVQVKPLSYSTCSSHGHISRSTKAESGVMPSAIQDGKSNKSYKNTGKEEGYKKSSTPRRRNNYLTDTVTIPAPSCNANISVENNVSVSDQGYISYQDNHGFDQVTFSSFASARFDTRNLNTTESRFPVFEESELYPFEFSHTKLQTSFRKSKTSFHPYGKRNSFRNSSPSSCSTSGACSPVPVVSKYLCPPMGLNVSSPSPSYTSGQIALGSPVGPCYRLYGVSSSISPSYGLIGSNPSPSSYFEPTELSPSTRLCCNPVIFSPSNSFITSQNIHGDRIGHTEKIIWFDRYNESQSSEAALTQPGSLGSYSLSGSEWLHP